MSANGSRPLPFISGKSWRKASIAMLLCLTPQRSSFVCSTILKLRAKSIFHKLSLEPELTNTYCTSQRSVHLTNRSIQMLQFFKTRAHSGFVVLLSPSPSLSFLSICMLFVKGGVFFYTIFILGLDI